MSGPGQDEPASPAGRPWHAAGRLVGALPHWVQAVFLSVALTGLFLLIVLALPQRPPLIVIDAETELVRYRVVRTEFANIPVTGADLRGDLTEACRALAADGTFTGLAAPGNGALVTYRATAGRVLVEIEPLPQSTEQLPPSKMTRLISGTQTGECRTGGRLALLYSIRDNGGAAAGSQPVNSRPLPLAGPAELGIEFGEPLLPRSGSRREIGFLWSGAVKVYGRTFLGGNAYPTSAGEISIPAGGRVTSIDNLDTGEPRIEDAWYGIVTPGADGLAVSATTETSDLRLFRAGRSSDAERFQTSGFARLFEDPSLAIVSIMAAFLVVLIQSITGLLGLRGGTEP